jgi:hypothetical protein
MCTVDTRETRAAAEKKSRHVDSASVLCES